MKKVALLLLAIVFAFMLFSCATPGAGEGGVTIAPGHEHVYDGELQYNATSHFRRCSCGKAGIPEAHVDENKDGFCDVCVFGLEVITCEHQWVEYCDQNTTCAICGGWQWDSIRGHLYEAVVTAPTCKDEGFTTHTCSYCGDVYTDTPVPALGHTPVADSAVAPDCVNTGLTEGSHCSVCEEVIVAQEVVPALGHTVVVDAAVAPTCVNTGLTEGSHCDVCEEVLVAQEVVPALGHTEGEAVKENEVAPDCENAGSYDSVIYCTVCGEELSRKTVTVDALGHTEGTVVVENNVAPDCVNDGSYDNVVYCSACNAELSRETVTVPALGHTEGTVVVENNVAPDCVSDGSYDNVVYCSACNVELSRETVTVDALGHTEGAVVVENNVAPDCVNDGSYDNVVYCSACNEELSRETITVDAIGHKAGDVVVENNVAPDCENDGSYDSVVYCSACNAELSRETITVDALGHTEGTVVVENNVAPDCVNDGSYDNVVYCSACNEELSRETITVDALGHAWGEEPIAFINNKNIFSCTAKDCNARAIEEINQTTASVSIADYATANEWKDSYKYSSVNFGNDITATVNGGGNTGRYYTNGNNWRLYQSESATITISVPSEISEFSVKITYTPNNGGYLLNDSTNISSGTIVTVNASSITLAVGSSGSSGQVRITAIEVVYVIESIEECEHSTTTITNNASCTEGGIITVACADCGIIISQESTGPVPHTEVVDKAVAATCTETGLTEGKHCSVCGEVLVAQKEIPVSDHSWNDATCTAPKTCSVCGTTEGEALGHKDENADYKCDACSTVLVPAANSILTIEQALALGNCFEHNTYTENKYYITGVVTNVYNITYGNMYLKDEKGNQICIYGLYSSDGKIAYDALTTKPIEGDTLTIYGSIGKYNSNIQSKNAWINELIQHEHNYVEGKCSICGAQEIVITNIAEALAAGEGDAVELTGTVSGIYQAYNSQFDNISVYITDGIDQILAFRLVGEVKVGDKITVTGVITMYNEKPQIAQGCTFVMIEEHVCAFDPATCTVPATCPVCKATQGDVVEHTYVNGICSVCGAEQPAAGEQIITAYKTVADLITEYGWTDSTTKQSFMLDDNVTVKIHGGANTGKAYNGDHIRIYATDTPAGTITISVAEGYELVSIKISAKTGTYAFLCLDGSTTDISNALTNVSGTSVLVNSVKNGTNGKQVQVTALEVVYKAPTSTNPPVEECTHANTTETNSATCTEDGTKTVTCDDCKEIITTTESKALGHNFVDGTCTRCGEAESAGGEVEPVETTVTYTFSNYTAGTQYATDEKHEMDDILTVTTTQAHFTTQLRLYSSSSNNGYAIFESGKTIKSITFNMGYKKDVLNIYTSEDGETWTLKTTLATTTTYKDYTAIELNSKYVKIDVAGSNQIRIASISVTYIG